MRLAANILRPPYQYVCCLSERSSPRVTTILTRLGQKGFGTYSTDTIQRGREIIKACNFELLISAEELPDGRGYDLIDPVIARGISLFIGIETSNDALWIPVVDHGENVLGNAAIDFDVLERELEDVLTHRSPCARPRSRWVPPIPPPIPEGQRHMTAISIDTLCEQKRTCETEPVFPQAPVFALKSLRLLAPRAGRAVKQPTEADGLKAAACLTRSKVAKKAARSVRTQTKI